VGIDKKMDITGWTLAQRMRFPEWTFGNKTLIGVMLGNSVVGTDVFGISTIALPDPCCIWKAMFYNLSNPGAQSWMRIGLNDVVPTTVAEMDACDEIFPDFGNPAAGPNNIIFYNDGVTYFAIDAYQGMVTGGQYLVMQVHNTGGSVRLQIALTVTELPSNLAGWLEHNIV